MQTFCPFYINYFCHVSTIYVSKKQKCLIICNGESSLQGGYADFQIIFTYLSIEISMPGHLEHDTTIILLMNSYLWYVQFYL